MANFSYNFVSVKTDIAGIGTWSYRTFDKIPSEFRNKYVETYPNNYYGIAFGTSYNLSKRVNIDLRYLYKINNETFNTNNFLLGSIFN